jgi:hypothetical protein
MNNAAPGPRGVKRKTAPPRAYFDKRARKKRGLLSAGKKSHREEIGDFRTKGLGFFFVLSPSE